MRPGARLPGNQGGYLVRASWSPGWRPGAPWSLYLVRPGGYLVASWCMPGGTSRGIDRAAIGHRFGRRSSHRERKIPPLYASIYTKTIYTKIIYTENVYTKFAASF